MCKDGDARPFFDSLKDDLLSQWLSKGAFERVLEFASRVPLSFCRDGALLESLLSEKECRSVDVSFFFEAVSTSLLEDLKKFRQRGEMWDAFYRLMLKWKEGKSDFAKYIRGMWLEFDADNSSIPSVFVSIDKKCADPGIFRNMLQTIHREFGESFFSKEQLQNGLDLFDLLPEGIGVCHLGFMGPRKGIPFRMCLSSLEMEGKKSVGSLLKRIGYLYDVEDLIKILKGLFMHNQAMGLSVDFSKGLMGRIGFEFSSLVGLEKDRMSAFIDVLVQNGLCSSESREKLLKFKKKFDVLSNPWLEKMRGHECEFECRQLIYYLKLVFNPNNQLIAKSYFWLHYAPKARSILSKHLLKELGIFETV